MAQLTPSNIQFFESPEQFRSWLETNSEKAKEVWVGFHKRDTGKPSLTWSESVDQALCFGWIDGIRKSLGETSYVIRFTPRNPKSVWSAVNIKKVEELKKQGLMKLAGIKLYEARSLERSEIYSFEQGNITLPEPYLGTFKENKTAWKNFEAMPPSYRKPAIWWVLSAKQEITRLKRLQTLIQDSENNLRIGQMRR